MIFIHNKVENGHRKTGGYVIVKEPLPLPIKIIIKGCRIKVTLPFDLIIVHTQI